MAVPASYIQRVQRRLLDPTGTSSVFGDAKSDALTQAIDQAIREYSGHRPRLLVVDVAGNGGTPYFDTASITGWVSEWSSIHSIEYPAEPVTANYRPRYLDTTSDWELYRAPTTVYIRLLTVAPETGTTLRITFTGLHTADVSTSTVLPADLEAVLDLAASYACQMLATEGARMSDPVNNSDNTNFRDQQLRMKQQATEWRTRYEVHMGIGGGGDGAKSSVPAGSIMTDWDPGQRQASRRWLTHGGRR